MNFSEEIAQATTPTNAERARLEAKADDARSKAFSGTVTSHLNRPLVSLWHDLHSSQVTWMRIPDGPLQKDDRIRFDEADRRVMAELAKTPAIEWAKLCSGIGWTIVGCAALTWCLDIEEPEIWDSWRQVADKMIARDDVLRACRLSKAETFKPFTSLSELSNITGGDQYLMSVLLAIRTTPIAIDLDTAMLGSAGPQLASFLLRSRRIDGLNPGSADSGQTAWSKTIKGTIYANEGL